RKFIRYVLSAHSAAVSAASSGTVPVPAQGVLSRRDAAETRNRDGCATLNRYFIRIMAPVSNFFFIWFLGIYFINRSLNSKRPCSFRTSPGKPPRSCGFLAGRLP